MSIGASPQKLAVLPSLPTGRRRPARRSYSGYVILFLLLAAGGAGLAYSGGSLAALVPGGAA